MEEEKFVFTPDELRETKELHDDLKEKLANMDHPFDKPETRAAITNVIRYVLYEELPESCYGNMANYQSQIFTYVSNRYGNAV